MGTNNRRRLLIALIALATVALTSVVFWPFIAAQIIAPIALLAWLLLRIFVLSISQQFYWYGAILAVLITLFRLWPQSFNNAPFEKHAEMNVAINTFERWRNLFSPTNSDAHSTGTLRQELVWLLLSLHATKQQFDADHQLHGALRRREIDLPDAIHAFLFPDETPAKPRSFLQRSLDFWLTPLKWAQRRRRQQREMAQRHDRIDEVLGYIEKSLETNNDNGRGKHDGY